MLALRRPFEVFCVDEAPFFPKIVSSSFLEALGLMIAPEEEAVATGAEELSEATARRNAPIRGPGLEPSEKGEEPSPESLTGLRASVQPPDERSREAPELDEKVPELRFEALNMLKATPDDARTGSSELSESDSDSVVDELSPSSICEVA